MNRIAAKSKKIQSTENRVNLVDMAYIFLQMTDDQKREIVILGLEMISKNQNNNTLTQKGKP